MIFGLVSKAPHDPSSGSVIDKIQRTLQWAGSLRNEIHYGHFRGVCLHDPNLSLSEEDFLYQDDKDEVLVMLDGFIYNQSRLAQILGFEKATPPPELICRAFQQMGPFFAEKLNGDFSICIYQKKKNKVLLYRDPLGIRPLATARLENGLVFSTDIMGLSKALFGNHKLERDFLVNKFLVTGFDYFLTPAKPVQKLKPGCFLEFDGRDAGVRPFWEPEIIRTDERLDTDQVIKDLKTLLLDAIAIRADGRFRASAHVSGGLDSGVVAALSRLTLNEQDPFLGFSWSPDRPFNDQDIAFDERTLVKKICEPYKIKAVFNNFTPEDRLMEMKDWRHPSELMFERRVASFARAKGIQLIFSGWGGDEFISLGSWGIDADLIRGFQWGDFLKRHPLSSPRKFLSSLVYHGLFPWLGKPFARQKTHGFIFPYLALTLGNNHIPRQNRLRFNSRRKVHLHLLNLRHLNQRTDDWYVLGQRHGIEYRYPLLDKRIVEYMLKIPSRCLAARDHYRMILREIGKEYLPPEVIQNTSKDDPVRSAFLYTVGVNATRPSFNELNHFRNNTDLAFFDFDLLEKHIREMKENPSSSKEEELLTALFFLKRAHEFTRGYYGEIEE